MCKVFKVDKSSYYNWVKNGCVIQKRPLNIPCQSNSDRRNPITPELKF